MKRHSAVFLLLAFSLLLACSTTRPDKWAEKIAPEEFRVRFETTAGDFTVYSKRAWSPAGVDRFYQLVRSGFYQDIGIFRVIPGFVAQFGIHDDSTLNAYWKARKVPDEAVLKQNERGTMAFARAGKHTRSSQLFINLESNSPRLDTIHYDGVTGFPVIAEVISGMQVVDSIYSGYGAEPGGKQDSIQARGNTYLRENYPKIDYILQARLVP